MTETITLPLNTSSYTRCEQSLKFVRKSHEEFVLIASGAPCHNADGSAGVNEEVSVKIKPV